MTREKGNFGPKAKVNYFIFLSYVYFYMCVATRCGNIGSALDLIGPVSVYCNWVR